jgi:polar amino acid transport system substrate-binding protein
MDKREWGMVLIKILFITLLLCLSNVAQTSNQLVFSTGEFFIFDRNKKIVSSIYKRLGYDVIVNQYPAKRALKMSNSGAVDGELFRIKGMQRFYPNLRIVPTAIDTIKAQALSIDLDI